MNCNVADFSVYVHIFPNGKKYVGITHNKVETRWRNGKGYCNQLYINRAIQKYKWHNIEHNVLYTDLTKEEAENMEIRLIKEWKTNISKYGYNIELGGKLSPVAKSTKQKISLSKIGKPSWSKGKTFSQEHKIRISLSRIGIKNGMYGKRAANAKKINQYDKNGDFIKLWEATMEIEKFGIANHSSVVRCCKKTQYFAGGYRWEYAK